MEQNVVELDVREHLKNKLEPFELIMSTVKKLGKDDIFVLHAPFKPKPLLGILKLRGLVNKCEKLAPDHWKVTFVHRSRKKWLGELNAQEENEQEEGAREVDVQEELPLKNLSADLAAAAQANTAASSEPPTDNVAYILDNRGLQPPQPMMRTLAKIDACKSGESVLIHNDRVPVFLIEELKAMGCAYTIYEQPDGSAKVLITKP
ncbi:MAG TPA: DUF2249 domain-containing protein [Bacilli bacterium]